MEVARLVLRQDAGSEAETIPTCEGSNGYDGRMGVRISSIFVILVGSLWGKSFICGTSCASLFALDEYITSYASQPHLFAVAPLTTSLLYISH